MIDFWTMISNERFCNKKSFQNHFSIIFQYHICYDIEIWYLIFLTFLLKNCIFPSFFVFWIIFSGMSVIYAYNCTWTLIWHHRPKIVDQSEISATPRASGISATLMFFSYFFHFYLFFKIFIKSTIFSNKNNNWCFWSSWPPKCCWLNWCCWGTSHPKITAAKQKKIRFFEQKI